MRHQINQRSFDNPSLNRHNVTFGGLASDIDAASQSEESMEQFEIERQVQLDQQRQNKVVVLQPNATSATLSEKSRFIKCLTANLILVVPNTSNEIQIWNTLDLSLVKTITKESQVNCAVGCSEFYFLGLASNQILIFKTQTHERVKTLTTRRAPVSMCIVDKRICVVGCRNHAFTSINFKTSEFKVSGMTWNKGSDWCQVLTNQENSGFYRVWQRENFTFATLKKWGPGTDPAAEVDFNWENDHVVNGDLLLLGEIDKDKLLVYSYTACQLLLYSKQMQRTEWVRPVLSPLPKELLEEQYPLQNVTSLTLHPKFYQPQNNFCIITGPQKTIQVCKMSFEQSREGDPYSKLGLERQGAGLNKLELTVSAQGGLITYQVAKDALNNQILKKLEFPRDQLLQMIK